MCAKKQEIMEGDWKNLIILDACRYDFFKEVYNEYLTGELEKRLSRGSCTTEWLCRIFKNQLNAVYFSTNPFINGKNMPLEKTVGKDARTKNINLNWNPTKHFEEVIDVWESRWNEEKGTVLPSDLVDAVLNSSYRKDRKIVHFVQPHQPYLTHKKKGKAWDNVARAKGKNPTKETKTKLMNNIKPYISSILKRTDKKTQWKIKDILGMKLNTIQRKVVNGNKEELQGLYRENLRIALENVSELVEKLNGKTIITADHGEAFGEEGDWAHKYGSENPVLREVPWLKVKM